MKYNKGFAPLILLAIIIGALVVGGGAVYFATKTPTSPKNIGENNYQPQENQNQNGVSNTPVENTVTNNTTNQQTQNSNPPPSPTCKPSITVLSPNGGETFILGQNINIKWSSKCINSNDLVYLNIGIKDSQAVSELLDGMKVANTGSYNFTIPNNYNLSGHSSNKYDLAINYIYGNGEGVGDHSNSSFTINSSTVSVSTANWKTYGNYGLSFKYPDTWSKYGEESSVVDLSGNIVAYEINFKDIISNTTLLISYHLPPNGSKLYDYAISEFNSKHGWYETGSKEINVAGGKAIEAFTTMNVDGRGNKINPPLRLIIVDFLDIQKTGSIQLQFKTPTTNEAIEVAKFNKFLSTFQLLLPS